MSDDTLFDPSRYGPGRSARAKPAKLRQVKLRPPWVLVRYRGKPPLAHLAFRHYLNLDRTPMIHPECNHKLGLNAMGVTGEPLVDVCRDCLRLAQRDGIEVA